MNTTALAALFESAEAEPVDVSFLQSADAFLNTAGESFRKRLFVTQNANGETQCLRPEFTIPVCQKHIESGVEKARYSYSGPVFRQRYDHDQHRPTEFLQAGMEWLGETESARTDGEIIRLALDAITLFEVRNPVLVVGNPAFFDAFIRPISLPNIWRERLLRAFGSAEVVNRTLDHMARGDDGLEDAPPPKLAALVKEHDLDGLTAEVETLLVEHGLHGTGGRTAEDIATRMLAKHAGQVKVDDKTVSACRDFLNFEVNGVELRRHVNTNPSMEGVDFSNELTAFEELLEPVTTRHRIPIEFSAQFGRRLDYYTGFVFEIYDADNRNRGPLAGGGRYDNLCEMLGGPPSPAVGFSLWLDRLTGGGDDV